MKHDRLPLNGREDVKACSISCSLPSNVDQAPSRASQCDDSTKTQVYDRCIATGLNDNDTSTRESHSSRSVFSKYVSNVDFEETIQRH
jgi:hypothetical protein